MEIHLLHRQGKSLREIARESGKAVNTIRKYLESQAETVISSEKSAALPQKPISKFNFDPPCKEN